MKLSEMIAEIVSEAECSDDRGCGSSVLEPEAVADTILALPEAAGWTALEGVSEALVDAQECIEELEAKLAEANAQAFANENVKALVEAVKSAGHYAGMDLARISAALAALENPDD